MGEREVTASRPGVTIIPIHGHTPRIHDSAFIAPGCTIIGNVEIGADSSVWYNCVLRADVSRIVIGERSNIQDGSVCHCDPERPGDPDGSPLIIGDDVLVGHMAMVHGCTIEDRGFVGLGAIAAIPPLRNIVMREGMAPGYGLRSLFERGKRLRERDRAEASHSS